MQKNLMKFSWFVCAFVFIGCGEQATQGVDAGGDKDTGSIEIAGSDIGPVKDGDGEQNDGEQNDGEQNDGQEDDDQGAGDRSGDALGGVSPPVDEKGPVLISPLPSEQDVDQESAVKWMCNNLDNEVVKSDLYFGTSSTPPLVMEATTEESYSAGTLEPITTYYWKVVCKYENSEVEGALWTFTTECAPFAPCEDAPTVTDDDGNVYSTVDICGQCWMAENLNRGNMMDIQVDAGASGNQQPDDGTVQKFCFKGSASNCANYGGLYQWNEAMGHGKAFSAQGICPAGWHLPTDDEWKDLEKTLGMDLSVVHLTSSWRGSDEGDQLKEGGSANFNAKIGPGFVETLSISDTYYDYQTASVAQFWTSSSGVEGLEWVNAYFRRLNDNEGGIYRAVQKLNDIAMSVRCVKD